MLGNGFQCDFWHSRIFSNLCRMLHFGPLIHCEKTSKTQEEYQIPLTDIMFADLRIYNLDCCWNLCVPRFVTFWISIFGLFEMWHVGKRHFETSKLWSFEIWEFWNYEAIFWSFGKDAHQEIMKNRSSIVWKSWIWDQYLPENMKWSFWYLVHTT